MKFKFLNLISLSIKISTYGLLSQVVFISVLNAHVGNAQYRNANDAYIDQPVKELSVKEVFDVIESSTDFDLIYLDKDLKSDAKVSLSPSSGRSIYDILMEVSKQSGLKFRQVNNGISVSKIEKKELRSDFSRFEILEKVEVAGKITDENGVGLPGTSIIEKGTTNGTTSDVDGNYRFRVEEDATLIVSFLGYKKQEINIGQRTTIDVQLVPDAEQLKEIVVVGYGTQKRANVTGAVAGIGSDRIKDFPVATFDAAISGQIAGVQVNEVSGAPGSSPEINIRGISTLTAGSRPLIVVDGMPISTENSNTNFINPSEIESISVLKDAASASIYGSRGGNGVILITTKRGSDNKPVFSFNAYRGVQKVERKVGVMNAYEHADLLEEVRGLENLPQEYLPYAEGTKGLVDTDWQDEIFREASISNYFLSASGGGQQFKYFISGTYFSQEGVVINSGYERFSLRANLEAKLADKLTLNLNLAPSFSSSKLISEEDHKQDGVVFTALLSNPTLSPYHADGTLDLSGQIRFGQKNDFIAAENPVALATIPKNDFDRNRFLAGTSLVYEPVKALALKTYIGTDFTYSRSYIFRPSTLGAYTSSAPNVANGTFGTESNLNLVFENTINYKENFGDHSLNALVGFSLQQENDEYNTTTGTDFPNDFVTTTNKALETTGSTYLTERNLVSYFGRLEYGLMDKYLLTFSLRRDGYSAFGKNSKWGLFPSVSGAWRISEESFFSNIDLVSDLKFRGSWGIAGNNQIPDFGGLSLLQTTNAVLGNQVVSGISPSTSPNENLSWEEAETVNFGLDLSLWESRINLAADVFRTTTNGLLLEVPVAAHSGYNRSLQNIGKIINDGIELELGFVNDFGALRLSTNANISFLRNEIGALGPDQDRILEFLHISKVGNPIGSYYGYKVAGVFNSQEQLNTFPHDPTSQLGSYIYEDINRDGAISEEDRTIIGDFFPDYAFGLSTRLSYKGFDLSFLIQGKQNFEIFNGLSFFLLNESGWGNVSDRVVNNYYVEGQKSTGKYARPLESPTDTRYTTSDLMVEDGSYVRVRNITFGYSLPFRLTNKIYLNEARVYATVTNPFTFTNYSGFNPEVSSRNKSFNKLPTTPGVDYGAYPLAKSIVVGLNLKF